MVLNSYANRLKRVPLADEDALLGRAVLQGVGSALRCSYGAYHLLGGERRGKITIGRIVSEKHKFSCTLIPKVGTKSLRAALLRDSADELGTYIVICQPGAYPRQTDRNYFDFAFVRNPWSRVVSCYKNKVLTANCFNKLNIISKYNGLRPQMPFEDFVEWLCSDEGRDAHADRHWISQHTFLTDEAGHLRCDFIGKIETFDRDMASVCERLSMEPVKIPNRNRATQAKESGPIRDLLEAPYTDFYSERTKDLIAGRYAKDIALFGYEFQGEPRSLE